MSLSKPPTQLRFCLQLCHTADMTCCVRLQHVLLGSSLGCALRVVSELLHFILPWAQIVFYFISNTVLGLLGLLLFRSTQNSQQRVGKAWFGCMEGMEIEAQATGFRKSWQRTKKVIRWESEKKNNNSVFRTGWAIYRAIKLPHHIKLNNLQSVSGEVESSRAVPAKSVMAQANDEVLP